jgi:DNA-binding CsgD family transcriptional regulator
MRRINEGPMKQSLNFDRMITEGAERWRAVGHGIDAAEKLVAAAANDPAASISQAQMTFAFVRAKQGKLQTYLRERFGIELDDAIGDESSRPRIRVVNKERVRRKVKTLEDVAEFRDVLISLMTYNTAWWAMVRAVRAGAAARLAKEAKALWWARFGVACPIPPPNYAASASLAAYLYVMRSAPIMYAPLIQQADEPPGLRQLQGVAAGVLTALVRSQLKMYDRLRVALSRGGDPEKVLLRELPGAVAEELGRLNAAAAGTDEPHAHLDDLQRIKDDRRRNVLKVLTNRVARRLEGRTASLTETELGEFADREEKLRLLKRGRDVGLPPREYELLKLLVEKPNISSREAGNALGITPGAVRALKSKIYRTLKVA